jgi:hypothetical protein
LKRTNQLVAESAIIGSLLVLTVVGGSLVGLGRPAEWGVASNPGTVASTHDPNALSLYYNNTLSFLGEGQFANVSQLLRSFPFVNVSPSVNRTALLANSEMAAMNVSIGQASLNLTASEQQALAHDLVNASSLAKSGCAQAAAAKSSFNEFANSTSPALASLGVPKQPYAVGEALVRAEIDSLGSECQSLLGLLTYSSASLTISSPQGAIATGGRVSLRADLTRQGAALPGQSVLFYLNGSYIGRLTTVTGGVAQANLSIPYVYEPLGVVTAVVSANASIGLQRAVSNSLNFTILFTETRIAIGDPSVYLPTFSFPVHGNLTTASGAPLPGAPVAITFFNETSYATTGPAGVFTANLTVPANATDGLAYVYATFAPQGEYGPSTNFAPVEVAHLQLEVTFDAPKLSLAGFTTTVSGTVTANGTAVPGAAVKVASPWGEFQTQSDGDGRYALALPVSISDFAAAQSLSLSATAAQAYIAPTQTTAGISLLNPLLIILPALGVGVTAYELDSLGLMPRPRRSSPREEPGTGGPLAASSEEALARAVQGSGIMLAYLQAVTLASRKLGIEFKESATMREMAGEVRRRDGAGAVPFSDILLVTEDFLYSRKFNRMRVREAEESLTKLKRLWGD